MSEGMIILKKGVDKKLAAGLYHHEVDCSCTHPSCRMTILKPQTINSFATFRARVGVPLIINSWYRCPLHNFEEEGAALSRHQMGEAVDINYKTFKHLYTPEQVIALLKECGFTFVLYYASAGFFHADTREL